MDKIIYRNQNNRTKFCIVTTQRSGSTWLKDLLDSGNQTKVFGEIFLWRSHHGWSDDYLIPYYQYRQASKSYRPCAIFRYLELIENYPIQNLNAIGFKLMYCQLYTWPEILLKLKFADYRIIHLIRENCLDKFISLLVMRKYGLVKSTEVEKRIVPVTIDIDELNIYLKRSTKYVSFVDSILEKFFSHVLEVKYEKLKDDTHSCLANIANFLDIDPDSFKASKSELKLLSWGSYRDRISNYAEVLQALRNTDYESYLLN